MNTNNSTRTGARVTTADHEVALDQQVVVVVPDNVDDQHEGNHNNNDNNRNEKPNDDNKNSNHSKNDNNNRSLDQLIDDELWDDVYERFIKNPNDAFRIVDPTSWLGWTYLHWLCSIPSVPVRLIDLVSSINPDAIIVPDSRYNDTPLHLICRNSVISSNKVTVLLKHCPTSKHLSTTPTTTTISNNNNTINQSIQQDQQQQGQQQYRCALILTPNIFGGTALHTAANFNSQLDVLRELVYANPAIIKIRTREGTHCITALWMSFMQTIHGSLTVARILKHGTTTTTTTDTSTIDTSTSTTSTTIDTSTNQDDNNVLFMKFWSKVEFLATFHFFYIQQQQVTNEKEKEQLKMYYYNTLSNEQRNNFVLHGLLYCDVPINLYLLALRINPIYSLTVDYYGNLPIHTVVENRPYRLKEREAILATIEASTSTSTRTVNSTRVMTTTNTTTTTRSCTTTCAIQQNNAGEDPLIIGIRNKIPWENGLDAIVAARPDIVGYKNSTTGGLYPFQYAATQGGRVAIETTFQLLLTRPDLLQ